MTGWLLDTNILSELGRPRPEPKVTAFIAVQPLESLYVNTVTFAEIRFGIERLKTPPGAESWMTGSITASARCLRKVSCRSAKR